MKVKRKEEKILEKAFHENIIEKRIVVCPGITADLERIGRGNPSVKQVVDHGQVRHILMRQAKRRVAETVKFRVPLGVVHACIIPDSDGDVNAFGEFSFENAVADSVLNQESRVSNLERAEEGSVEAQLFLLRESKEVLPNLLDSFVHFVHFVHACIITYYR